jgi:hypothetical protein
VTAVYASRCAFTADVPPQELLKDARTVRAAGLSLNLLCQQYPDQELARLLERGAVVQCLFLAPEGSAIAAREREEGHNPRTLSVLTKLNIQVLQRIRDRLSLEARERLMIATYDETIRFNIVLVNDQTAVVQPYLPNARGVESPTLVMEKVTSTPGLFETFAGVFESLWDRGNLL